MFSKSFTYAAEFNIAVSFKIIYEYNANFNEFYNDGHVTIIDAYTNFVYINRIGPVPQIILKLYIITEIL